MSDEILLPVVVLGVVPVDAVVDVVLGVVCVVSVVTVPDVVVAIVAVVVVCIGVVDVVAVKKLPAYRSLRTCFLFTNSLLLLLTRQILSDLLKASRIIINL